MTAENETRMAVTDTVTATGMRSVQVWHPSHRLFKNSKPSPLVVASIISRTDGAPGSEIHVSSECPTEWLDRVLGVFASLRKSGQVKPTHRVVWSFGGATLHPLAEPVAEEEQQAFDFADSFEGSMADAR